MLLKMKQFIQNLMILSVFFVTIKAGVIDYDGSHEANHEIDIKFDSAGFDGNLGDSDEHGDPPKYSFNYAVNDPHTGDIKQHVEERDGHTVKGSYSLKEADGSTRIVEYHADKENGFNAKVHTIPGDPDNGHSQYTF